MIVGGDYIRTDSGTGLVHCPWTRPEDYLTGLKEGLPLLSPVNDLGQFTEEAGEQFKGLNVLGEGNTAVIEALEATGNLIKMRTTVKVPIRLKYQEAHHLPCY